MYQPTGQPVPGPGSGDTPATPDREPPTAAWDHYPDDGYWEGDFTRDTYAQDAHTQDPYAQDAYPQDGAGHGGAELSRNKPDFFSSDPRSDEPPLTSGRHRSPRRWPIPVGLAGIVAVLLLALGIGAALLPPSFAGGSGQGTPAGVTGNLAEPGTGIDSADVPGEESEAAASPSPDAPTPSPSVTESATPAASPSPSKSKASKASPTPSRTPNRTTAPSTSTSGDSRETEVIEIVNQERAANGCDALKVNSQLTTAARLHSKDQAATNNMSHTGSDGSSPSTRAQRAGYTNGGVGENVAWGYKTAEDVMKGWMNSTGHRNNILNCRYTVIGVGVAAASGGSLYWTQVFGTA